MVSAIAIVVSGVFLLKPVLIVVFVVCKAIVVECFVLNPCWCVWLYKLSAM